MARHLIKRGAIAGALVIGLEAAYAMLRPTPLLPEFDPSATFGDPKSPQLRVVVLGDSSVTAPGVAGPEEVWVSLICQRLAAKHHVLLESLAVGGSCAHDLVQHQVGPAIELEPDLILVAVGANDVIRGVSRKRFEKNLDHLVSDLASTGATIVLSGVGDLGTIPRLHPPLRHLISHRAAGFDRIHRRVAARHGAHVVEQRADRPADWYSDRSLWAADLFHVSAAGHRRWADVVWATLEPQLTGGNGRRDALARLERSPIAHLATTRPDGGPHLVPVTFALDAGQIVHMVDHKPKSTTRLQRLVNITANPRASLLVDHYNDDWARLWWVRIDGPARVVEDGPEWVAARALLAAEYDHYQDRPPQGPAVYIAIDKVTGWVGSG